MAMVLIWANGLLGSATAVASDPLPNWNDGEVKQGIIEFVARVTDPDSPDFVAPEDRIATFDNDGTLWAEQPYVQLLFTIAGTEAIVAADPALRSQEPYKSLLDPDFDYLTAEEDVLADLLANIYANRTQAEYEAELQQFFQTAVYPPFNVPLSEVTYLPMVELLGYLQDNGFQTWICSGGGIDFMRQISESYYGIPPQQVIGTRIQKDWREHDGKMVIWRLPEITLVANKEGKPIGINLHIGKPPIFSAGNVRSGGDIAHLTYSQQQQPSMQLMINHDDAEREFAYTEPDNASLEAAAENGWTVVSMKDDWKTIFAFQGS
ncbi:haloacid dehalogenase-like hydrolase [filamentous cyanobacterium CCP3]|nr:haloacid dehalogenase-like hydrolase [filamentous cyanobacterium CCP3]